MTSHRIAFQSVDRRSLDRQSMAWRISTAHPHSRYFSSAEVKIEGESHENLLKDTPHSMGGSGFWDGFQWALTFQFLR